MLELFVNINVYYQKYLSNCLVVSEKSCIFAPCKKGWKQLGL